jgi:hypothetical protein
MALMDQTRKQLRQRVASLFDDLTELVATGNGTTLTFVDTFNVNTGSESFDGCEIHFTSGSNLDLNSRVTATTAASGTLTFTPARTSTATSDTAELYNRRNRGFRVQDYHRAINQAIEEYQGIAMIPVIESIAAAYDAETQTFAIPSTTLEVHTVEYQDSDDLWQRIRPARPRGGFGWTFEAPSSVIRIEGDPAWEADGYSLRIHGYKRQDALTADTSVVPFDSTALVYTAAANLCLSKVGADSRYASMAVSFRQSAAMNAGRVRTLRTPGTGRSRL